MTQTELDGLASECGSEGAAVWPGEAGGALLPRHGHCDIGQRGGVSVRTANRYCRLLWVYCYRMDEYLYMSIYVCLG